MPPRLRSWPLECRHRSRTHCRPPRIIQRPRERSLPRPSSPLRPHSCRLRPRGNRRSRSRRPISTAASRPAYRRKRNLLVRSGALRGFVSSASSASPRCSCSVARWDSDRCCIEMRLRHVRARRRRSCRGTFPSRHPPISFVHPRRRSPASRRGTVTSMRTLRPRLPQAQPSAPSTPAPLQPLAVAPESDAGPNVADVRDALQRGVDDWRNAHETLRSTRVRRCRLRSAQRRTRRGRNRRRADRCIDASLHPGSRGGDAFATKGERQVQHSFYLRIP